MKKETYAHAKRAACVRYIDCAERDKRNGKTRREWQNAENRAQHARRILKKLDDGTFWTPSTEWTFRTLYERFDDADAEAVVSAV